MLTMRIAAAIAEAMAWTEASFARAWKEWQESIKKAKKEIWMKRSDDVIQDK